MSETNKDIAVTFYKAVIDGRIEDAFRLYAGGGPRTGGLACLARPDQT
jgi:hypothetical protein